MLRIENVDVFGWEAALRGMRNPLNSWEKSDSHFWEITPVEVGDNDLALMKKLCKAGTDHRKFMRMINVTCDITAPMYWWKEFDTYKVGTVRNSCSTMHTIMSKEFALDDFSHEHFIGNSPGVMSEIVHTLNMWREAYITLKGNGGDSIDLKKCWWQIIQLLPQSYNQRATVQLNYEVLANMYHSRKAHKLDEWREFCEWVEALPYNEIITGINKGE